MVSVLLSASVKKFSVSPMRDFCIGATIHIGQDIKCLLYARFFDSILLVERTNKVYKDFKIPSLIKNIFLCMVVDLEWVGFA